MSRYKSKVLDSGAGSAATPVTAVGQTLPISTEELDEIEVQITGITTGTVQVQRSLDGVNWIDEGSPLTADGIVTVGVGKHAAQVRGDVTVDTSVAVVIAAAGLVRGGYG